MPGRTTSSDTDRDTASAVIAVIPAHDEASHIGAVVTTARRHVPVLVVDDGSSDETATRAREAGAAVVSQHPNRGKGAALRAGLARALDGGASAVITLDADGQHDPDEIPAFLEAWARGAPDLVIGSRAFDRMPRARRLANHLGGLVFSRAVGRPVPDNQSGYRLISRRLAERMLDSQEQGFEFEVEMIAVAIRDRLSIAWVPIRTIYAGETSHIRPFGHFVRFLRATRRARRIARGVSS